MDEGLLHLPIQMNEWLISGARIAGMNVWRWALSADPALLEKEPISITFYWPAVRLGSGDPSFLPCWLRQCQQARVGAAPPRLPPSG